VDKDLRRKILDKARVVAAVVHLLDEEKVRVGTMQYARANKSFGATTLMGRHVRRKNGRLMMRFAGKHGIVHELALTDRRLARVVKRCQELPGQMLFQYVNGSGEPQPVTSADVND
jgi:DNA topoisomerase-1